MTTFTIGLRIAKPLDCKTFDQYTHITLAYCPNSSNDKYNKILRKIELLKNFLPCKIILGEEKMYGTKNDLPVRVCSLENEYQFREFDKKIGTLEHKDSKERNYHMTLKNSKDYFKKDMILIEPSIDI